MKVYYYCYYDREKVEQKRAMQNQDIIPNATESITVNSAPPVSPSPQPRATSQSLMDGVEVLNEGPVSNDIFEGCVRLVKEYQGKFTQECEMAKYLKEHMELKYGRHWEVVVASSTIGCLVAHEPQLFFHFRYDKYLYIVYRVPDLNSL